MLAYWKAALSVAIIFTTVFVALLPPHRKGFLSGKRYVMPPGPRGVPVFGSLLAFLAARQQGQMVSWVVDQASRYGEFTTLSMGSRTWVLLNSPRVAHEIIANHASITHERPELPIAGGLVSRNERFFLKKTNDWREGRRLLHHLLMGTGSKEHKDLVEEASVGLLCAYLDEPRKWYAHNYRYPISVMNVIITGAPMKRTPSELDNIQKVTSLFLSSINSHLVDFFPQLARLPRTFQFWRPYWESLGLFQLKTNLHWWNTGLKPGTEAYDKIGSSTFVHDVISGGFSGTEEQAMYMTMLVLSAGADNPRMSLNAVIMACLSYPEAMKRARHEVDGVCGADAARLPNLDDLVRMPYVCALVKEVLRWRPTVPVVPQRVLVEDLEFESYRFPAGTEFVVNSVPVCYAGHDRPQELLPERWLEGRQPSKEHPAGHGGGGIDQSLWEYAFNAGRRSCVGYKLAQKELFVAAARLIYCFDIVPAGPFDDRQLNPFKTGEPFPAEPRIRSPAHKRLVREKATECRLWGT